MIDEDGEPVSSADGPEEPAGPGKTELFQTTTVPNPALWAGADYLGESGVGSIDHSGWPSHASHVDILDLCSFMKPSAYHRKALWSDEPVVYIVCETQEWAKHPMPFWGWPKVASHWNWESHKEAINVRCYSNCDQVELFLNGKSLGEQRLSGDMRDYQGKSLVFVQSTRKHGKISLTGRAKGLSSNTVKISCK